MQDFYVRRMGHALYAADPESDEHISRLPSKGILKVRLLQPRNVRRFRLYWVICKRIADAVGADIENISDLLKLRTGHYRTVHSKTMGELRFPSSIAFDRMEEPDFKEFLDRCMLVISEEWQAANLIDDVTREHGQE